MSNIYRDLSEAYKAVYTSQEVDEATAMAKRGLDEPAIRQKIAKSTGGGAAADRATKLENQPTYGDSNKAKQRQNLARKQRGDFRNTTSSNPGLHAGQHKSNDPAVKAKQAARGAQRGALTPGEKKQLNMGDETFDIFDLVLEFLQVEGYAETLEEAEWMMANVIDEEAIEIILGEAQDATPPKGQSKYGRKAPAGYMQTRKPTLQQMSSREKQAFKDRGIGEEYVDEAQAARENPEKYEREQAKKTAPVRGEKTPMPPRGDKRREDFEKWYAANVR